MSGSDNVRGAEDQQERLEFLGWVVGFVDGEGCFSCPIFRNQSMSVGWQVQPSFSVVQSAQSKGVLEDLVHLFGCGRVYVNHRRDNHREDLYRFHVSRFSDLQETIVPFFRKYQLRTAKRIDFAKFAKVIDLMSKGKHRTISGIQEIAEIAETMNRRKPSEFLRILRDHTPTISRIAR